MLKFGACPLEKSQLDSSMSSNGGCRDGWMYRRMDRWMDGSIDAYDLKASFWPFFSLFYSELAFG